MARVCGDRAGEGRAQKVVCIRLDGTRVLQNQSFEVQVNFSCDDLCSSIPGIDFWVEDDNTLAYRTFLSQPYDLPGDRAEKRIRLF